MKILVRSKTTHPLDVPAGLRNGLQRIIRDAPAVRDIQTLQSEAVLGNLHECVVSYELQLRHIQREQAAIALEHARDTHVGQLGTVGKGEALDALAAGEGQEGSIADLVAQGREIEAFDEIVVVKGAIDAADGLDDVVQALPVVCLRPVPQQSNTVARPLLRDQHAVSQIARGGEAGEYGEHQLGREAGYGRDAVLLSNIARVVIVVWDRGREGRDGLVVANERLIVVVGLGGRCVCRRVRVAGEATGAVHAGGSNVPMQAEGEGHVRHAVHVQCYCCERWSRL